MKKILLFVFLFFPIIAMDLEKEEDPGCCPQLVQFYELSSDVVRICCIGCLRSLSGRHRPPFTFHPLPRDQEPENIFTMLYNQCFEQIED